MSSAPTRSAMSKISKWTLLALLATLSISALSPALAQAADSDLTLYVYPPRQVLNWQSPKSLLSSFLSIGIQKTLSNMPDVKFVSPNNEPGSISTSYISTMGHTIAHVKCELPNGQLFDRWSSFSGQDYGEVDDQNAFKDKIGLGLLFFDYIDGHIISGDENIRRITYYRGSQGSPRYMQFKIDPAACDRVARMITFFEGFHFKKGTSLEALKARGPENTLYFNTMDPYDTYLARVRNGHGIVGGGCAPYGAALLKIIGQYDFNIFENSWRTPVVVSEKLIGGIPDALTGQINRVSVGSLLFSDASRSWTHAGYPNRKLDLYDPQRIWDFVGNVQHCLNREKGCSPDALAWLNKRGGAVVIGNEQIFQNSITTPAPQTGSEAYGGPSLDTKTTRVNGIVIN